MMRSQVFKSAIAGLVAVMTSGIAAACVTANVNLPERVAYNPVDDQPTIINFDVQLTNACAVPLDGQVQVWFSDDVEIQSPGRVGNVPYHIQRRSNLVLETPDRPLIVRDRIPLNAMQKVVQYELVLAPGFHAVSEARRININLLGREFAGDSFAYSLEFPISLAPRPGISLSLADGTRSGKVNFGKLEAGEVRTVSLTARSAHPYAIELTSDYDGKLRLVDRCGQALDEPVAPHESVDYSVSIDGRPLDVDSEHRFQRAPSAQIATYPHLLGIQIDPQLDPGRKRAGRYCDILTLTIRPAH